MERVSVLEDLGDSYRLVRKSLADQVTCEQRCEGSEELNHENIQEHPLQTE